MSALRDVVVVGAGLAGLSAAQQLRELGFDGTLTIVGDEPRPPYDRPPLSKRVLTGEEPPDVTLPGADALGAGWSLGAPAVALDPVEGTVTTSDGRRHRADGVVIATGARPRPWSGPGAALHGVRPLATLPDALALREVLDRAGRLLVLGGGFVGAEVAAAARSRGSAVTVVEQRDVLLGRPLGTAGADPALDAAVYQLKTGEGTKAPVKVGDKWVVVAVKERRDTKPEEFDRQKAELTERALRERRDQLFDDFIVEARRRLEEKGQIEINRDTLALVEQDEPAAFPGGRPPINIVPPTGTE
jgi:NADPH-dependent 2,4-dienoyl-CoA reductase/sulfur reductase-like enzyme